MSVVFARNLLQRLLTPPAGGRARGIEHLVCVLAAFSCLREIFNILKLGPRKAYKKIVGGIFGQLSRLPGVGGMVDGALDKELAQIRHDILGDGDSDAHIHMPSEGMSNTEIIAKAKELKALESAVAEGKQWGGVYHDLEGDLVKLQNEIWGMFNCSNTLYPTAFPASRKFEAEVVSMTLDIVHGHEHGAVGLLSSGGTESILLAVLAYREQAKRKGIRDPEIIAALSAHPALTKACHYFGVTLTKVAICPKTLRLLPETVEKAINASTVAVYTSAPSFSHGVVDPIEDIAAVCQRRGVGLHVDNCLGGYLLSYLSKEGIFTRKWDFEVPGVTTMSIDVHKYGNSSKGVSVVCFRDPDLRRGSYMPSVDGCEGLYVTATLQGSRSGATMAQAWATLLSIGDSGYRQFARQIHSLTEQVKECVRSLDGVELLTDSDCAIVPIAASKGSGVDIYLVASVMEKKGWNLFTGQHPPVMSICLGETHIRVMDQLLTDLRDSVETVKSNPNMKAEGNAAVYGAAAAIPDQLLDSILRSYVDIRYEILEKK